MCIQTHWRLYVNSCNCCFFKQNQWEGSMYVPIYCHGMMLSESDKVSKCTKGQRKYPGWQEQERKNICLKWKLNWNLFVPQNVHAHSAIWKLSFKRSYACTYYKISRIKIIDSTYCSVCQFFILLYYFCSTYYSLLYFERGNQNRQGGSIWFRRGS